MHLPSDILTYFITITNNINFLFKARVPPFTEIRFYSCRPVHAPERLARAMLKHEVEVLVFSRDGDDIQLGPAHKRRIFVQNASLSSSKSPDMTDIPLKKTQI